MFVNFGVGKCPVCGNFGKKVEKDNFSCQTCNIIFDKFFVTATEDQEEKQLYWN